MNDVQQKVHSYEDEIDLKVIFLALWKRKILIVSLALAGAILAGIFSIAVLTPVYNTKLNIVISMPEMYYTKYGEYKLPITTNEQYINLITSNDVLLNTIKDLGNKDLNIDKIKKQVSIGQVNSGSNVVQNSFDVTVSAAKPEKALKLAEALFKNYTEFMDVMTKERAVNYYYNKFNVDLKSKEVLLKSEKELLNKNKDLLAQTPKTINQKEAMKEIQGQIADVKDFVVLENIINPNYTKVEADIIANRQKINDMEEAISVLNENIAELEMEKKAVENYYSTGKTAKLESALISVVETSVYLPSPPVAPTNKTSPSNARNAAIGLILGGIIGVMAALVKEYWLKKE